MRAALARATRYVLEAQDADGAWRDFELDGTPSDAWVTAYVGLGLHAVAGEDDAVASALAAAREALFASFAGRHGWGFNGRAPVDADSTAFATVFLAATGGAPPQAYETLRSHRREDGGYACYERFSDPSTWMVSHVDVSALALGALLTEPRRDAAGIARCAEYLRAQQRADAAWPSYWYATPLYSVARVLEALGACGDEALAACRLDDAVRFAVRTARGCGDAFALALALEVVARFGAVDDADALSDELLALQRIDGRWTAKEPFMRPDPWNYEGDEENAAIFDPRGLFTTATVLRALAQVRVGAATARA